METDIWIFTNARKLFTVSWKIDFTQVLNPILLGPKYLG